MLTLPLQFPPMNMNVFIALQLKCVNTPVLNEYLKPANLLRIQRKKSGKSLLLISPAKLKNTSKTRLRFGVCKMQIIYLEWWEVSTQQINNGAKYSHILRTCYVSSCLPFGKQHLYTVLTAVLQIYITWLDILQISDSHQCKIMIMLT